MVWGAICRNWKSPLVFLEGASKKGVCEQDYSDQVLELFVGSAFNGLLGYSGYEQGGLYIEDQAPFHGTKGLLVEATRVLGIPLHDRPSSQPHRGSSNSGSSLVAGFLSR